MLKQKKTMGTTSTKRTVYASKGVAVVGPGKEDVVGGMDKYCEEDANEANTARRWWRWWMIGKVMPMRTMIRMDSRCSVKSFAIVAQTLLGLIAETTARRFPSQSRPHHRRRQDT